MRKRDDLGRCPTPSICGTSLCSPACAVTEPGKGLVTASRHRGHGPAQSRARTSQLVKREGSQDPLDRLTGCLPFPPVACSLVE